MKRSPFRQYRPVRYALALVLAPFFALTTASICSATVGGEKFKPTVPAWKFTPGQVWQSTVEQQTDWSEVAGDQTKPRGKWQQQFDVRWEVQQIDPQGLAVLNVQFERIRWQKTIGTKTTHFDSLVPEATAGPEGQQFGEQVAGWLQVPLQFKLNTRGVIYDVTWPTGQVPVVALRSGPDQELRQQELTSVLQQSLLAFPTSLANASATPADDAPPPLSGVVVGLGKGLAFPAPLPGSFQTWQVQRTIDGLSEGGLTQVVQYASRGVRWHAERRCWLIELEVSTPDPTRNLAGLNQLKTKPATGQWWFDLNAGWPLQGELSGTTRWSIPGLEPKQQLSTKTAWHWQTVE